MKIMKSKRKNILLGLLSLAFALPTAGLTAEDRPCSLPSEQGETASGSLLSGTLIGQITAEALTQKFSAIGIQARNAVKIYRVSYHSCTPKDDVVRASGIVLAPDNNAPVHPWISLQHGTIAAKARAPSLSPGEGLVEASQGFLTVVADYLGYGDSADLFHPYIIEQAYIDSNLAMLRAARSLAEREGWGLGPLFLKGYSEGGYATLALQKALEGRYKGEFTVTASAPAAGPYDPLTTGHILAKQKAVSPVNVPFLVLSYNEWFGKGMRLNLENIFLTPVEQLKEVLSGAYDNDEVEELLPTTNAELFRSEFLEDFTRDGGSQTKDARILNRWLKRQSLLNDRWVPTAPTRFYHCIDDEEVPVRNTELAMAHYQGLSADAPVSAVLIPSKNPARPYTHGDCPGIFAALAWFAEILSPQP